MKQILKSIVALVYAAASVYLFIYFDKSSHSSSDSLINFVPSWAVLTLVYVVINRYLLRSKK